MTKKIIFIVFFFIIIASIGFGYYKYGRMANTGSLEGIESINDIEGGATTTPNITGTNTSLSIKDRAWTVLENYLKAAQKRDLPELKRLSYQISDVCTDPSKIADCNIRMGTVYYFGSNMKKEDFINVWSDSKQVVLSTDLKREENETTIAYSKGIIYFVIDTTGNIKLLKFNDSKGVSMSKEGRTIEEIDSYLKKRMLDEDQDGIEDEIERCEGQPE